MATPDVPLSEQSSLWRDRSFVLFWFARVVSEAGSIITIVVLPILIFQLTGSALRTSLLATLQVLPYFVFGLFAGALADRFNRRRMMVIFDLINAALLGSIPLAAALNILTLTHIYVVALLSASAFVWFDAANFGALPTLVGPKRIFEANSIIWAAATTVGIIGPAVGGVLATTIGAAETLSLDAISYVLSAVAISLIPRALSHPRPATPEAETVIKRTLSDIREGLAFIWRHPLVRPLTFLGFGVSFTGGAMIGLLVVSAVQGLGLAENDNRIGLLYTAGAAGALLASLLLPRLNRRFPAGWITLFGMFASLIMLIFFALTQNFLVGLLVYLLWDCNHSLVIINGIALRQMVTPEQLQGRVNVTARMIAWGGQPFGAATAGILAELWGVRTALLLCALGVALSFILGLFSPLRHRETGVDAS